MKKVLLVIGGLFVLIIIAGALASGGTDSGTEKADTTTDSATKTDSDPSDSETTTDSAQSDIANDEQTESDSNATEKGTKDNPYKFGEAHSRDAGMLGAAWTVSIDDVRTDQAISPLFTEDASTAGKTCTIVLGTATLDALDSEDLTSNPFSFPTVTFVDSTGASLDSAYQCDTTGLSAEGYKLPVEIQLTEGASAKWMIPYLVESPDYQLVAIENTVYAE